MKGQTTRMLLRALIDLSEGHDVMIVALDAAIWGHANLANMIEDAVTNRRSEVK